MPDFTHLKNFNLSVIDLRINPNIVVLPSDDYLTLVLLDTLV